VTGMNPRTHPRGARPDFTAPKPNPNPERVTGALWWLVCMREALEPKGRNAGTYGNKPGSHNIGSQLPDYGAGDRRTDHSIRDSFNRTGPWWKSKTAAHDWTFVDAQRGDFTTIKKYTNRLIKAMKDPADPRPDDTYFYTLGQADDDLVIEGYNERDDAAEHSSDATHTWHRHDSLRRNIVGSYWHMWQALTIDMGWTVAEWRQSLEDDMELTDTIRWNTTGVVKYSKPTTTVEGALRSTHYYVLQTRDAVLAELRKAALRDAAILAAVAGVDEEGVLAAVDTRAAALAGMVAEIDARLAQMPAELLDALADEDSSDEDTAAALRVALGDRAGRIGRILAGALATG
jgi:hypothetical protein